MENPPTKTAGGPIKGGSTMNTKVEEDDSN
jgi:hypothetical protein